MSMMHAQLLNPYAWLSNNGEWLQPLLHGAFKAFPTFLNEAVNGIF